MTPPSRGSLPSISRSSATRSSRRVSTTTSGGQGALLLVQDPAGEVVGTAAVRFLAPGVGELKRMWLRPTCQGRGLGRRLMDASLEEARRLGCRSLRLDTESKLEAAVHLYRAYGFVEIPRYNDNRRADIWMERSL